MTTLVQVALLVTMPLRIIWVIARECGKSLAVVIGTAWIDSRGGFHWRGE